MADVFMSYAHEDAPRVEPLIAMLESNGCRVWWDRNIEPGSNFEQKIEQALSDASCVMIALTRHAAESDWMRAETVVGQHHGKLIPVLLDDVAIPLPLRALQVADLRDWPNGSKAEADKSKCQGNPQDAQSQVLVFRRFRMTQPIDYFRRQFLTFIKRRAKGLLHSLAGLVSEPEQCTEDYR